ncbi:MAG: hypothetical protein P8M34_06655 [Saprospiraceae bacterium]|nr:hypothetical protein [Saprospiraceae bacterium]|tara:strand:+ start:602 stop:916 length:315 start_codon:yes stop_codon:yes gene_type:complete
MQFSPVIVSVMLLMGGVGLLSNHSKTNFALALFGHTALEEIIFDWLGIISHNLPLFAVALFFGCVVIALWLAYSNAFDLKRLSSKEVVLSLLIGAGESLLLNSL